VVASEEPLIVEEATRHELVADNLAIRDLKIHAYLGIPLFTPDGHAIGSLCAIDSKSRVWTEKDVEVLGEIADLVMTEIEMRHHLRERNRAEQGLAQLAEQLLASNEELRQFASIASHDLKEPLRKIQAFADRLSSNYSNEIDERGQDYIERMTDASKRMQRLIDALLALTQVTSQARPYVPTDLGKVFGEVFCDLEKRIEDTAGRVEIGALHTIEADPLQMQ
jgi:light-regulated signal transduction histidine kinase (bacteriophytochrome)